MRLHQFLPTIFLITFPSRTHVVFAQKPEGSLIPNGWQNTTSSLSRDEVQGIARAAIDQIVPLINRASGTIDDFQHDAVKTASLLSVLSLYDFFSESDINKDNVTAAYGNLLQNHPHNMSQTLHWGLASYYAYRAYESDFFLQAAVEVWGIAHANMLTQEAAQNGTFNLRPGVSIPVPASCASVVGAVFEFATPKQPPSTVIQAETMGAFLTLSSYLSGEQNGTSEAADLSSAFIRAHMVNGSTVNPLNFDISSCLMTTDDQIGMMNIGLTIEGLSVRANQSSDDTLSRFVDDLIARSINYTWTGQDGVIVQEGANPDELQSGAKAWFIRGLHEAWSRASDRQSDTARLIESYITVQFNALQDMKSAGSNYTSNWTSPSGVPDLDPWANVIALDVLNSAFDIAVPQTNSSPPANSTSPSPSPLAGTDSPSGASNRSSSSHTGAIAGGAVGGAVGIALIISAAFYFLRRRKYRTVNKAPSSFFADRLVSPPSLSMTLTDQVDYGSPMMEKQGQEGSDSTNTSSGVAV